MSDGPAIKGLRCLFYGLVCLLGCGSALATGEQLSPHLRQWVQQHEVRVGPERDYGPFSFEDEAGAVAGLSVDMLRLVQSRTGLNLQMLASAPLHQQLDAARGHQIDLLMSLRPTPERGAFLLFTKPYVSVPAVLVRRVDGPVLKMAQLVGKPVAVGKGYAVESVMRQRHPGVNWQAVPDDVAALQGVHAGRFEAAVVDSASLAFVTRSQRLQGLQAGEPVDFEYTLSFAVRSDWPELVAVLDAGIRALTPAQRQAVQDRWMPVIDRATALRKAPVATGVGLALLLLALLAAAWMIRQKRVLRGSGDAPPQEHRG
jgi:ABC-type amino acid transport substrate-binding protein